jgi:hypothetical protein
VCASRLRGPWYSLHNLRRMKREKSRCYEERVMSLPALGGHGELADLAVLRRLVGLEPSSAALQNKEHVVIELLWRKLATKVLTVT